MVSLNVGPNGGTATQYFVGDFDGTSFSTTSNNIKWVDYGTDNYAGNTYNNIPAADGRRIFIGWMSNWSYAQSVPTTTWRSSMTVPRALSLISDGADYLLQSEPLQEVKSYINSGLDTTITTATNSIQLKDSRVIKTGSYEVDFSANLNASGTMTLSLGNSKESVLIAYDKNTGYITVDRSASGKVDFNSLMRQKIYCPFTPKAGSVSNFQLIVDKTSLELFVNHGEKVVTVLFFPNYQYDTLSLNGDNISFISGFSIKALNKSINR